MKKLGRKPKKGWCSVCGGIWCDEHDCCPLDCRDMHCKKTNPGMKVGRVAHRSLAG